MPQHASLKLAVLLALTAHIALAQSPAPPAAVPAQPATAQAATAPAKPIPFEVVSIRKNISQRVSGLRFTTDGFSTEGSAVLRLLSMLGNTNTTALPGWCGTERYNIAAKVAESDIAAWQKLGYKERNLSIRTMLEDRFNLKWHMEPKMDPGFELVVAKSGSKLKEATPGETYPNSPKSRDGTPWHGVSPNMLPGVTGLAGLTGVTGQSASMDQLTNILEVMFVRALVVDKTGLKGTYDFTLTAAPEPPLTAGDSDPPVNDGPSLFSAVQQQLGLKLVPAKVPVETLVVDHIERPTPN